MFESQQDEVRSRPMLVCEQFFASMNLVIQIWLIVRYGIEFDRLWIYFLHPLKSSNMEGQRYKQTLKSWHDIWATEERNEDFKMLLLKLLMAIFWALCPSTGQIVTERNHN